jgi:cytochrome c biogenesis protein CcmG/thiol:disulfide interchange protein DsbE
MKSNTVVWVVLVACALCFVLAACGLCLVFGLIGSQAGGFDFGLPPQTGRMAPDFQLETIEGELVTLGDFRGQPVLLNFWAIWCGPCQEEIPVIQDRFQQHYPDLVVLAVEEGESLSRLQSYIEETGLTFAVLVGSEAVARRYAIRAYPTSFFIDRNGVIRSIVIGSMSGASLDAELEKIGVDD